MRAFEGAAQGVVMGVCLLALPPPTSSLPFEYHCKCPTVVTHEQHGRFTKHHKMECPYYGE